MRFQGARHLFDWLQTAANGAGIPALEVAFGRPAPLLFPEAVEVLLVQPGARGLEILREQFLKSLEALIAQVRRVVEPELLGTGEPLIPLFPQLVVLTPTHLVHRFIE